MKYSIEFTNGETFYFQDKTNDDGTLTEYLVTFEHGFVILNVYTGHSPARCWGPHSLSRAYPAHKIENIRGELSEPLPSEISKQ